MMKTKHKILIWIAVVFIVGFIPVCYLYVDYYHNNIKGQPIRYCYQEYYGSPNEVIIVQNKEDIEDLILYYKEIEKGKDASFTFDLKTLPMTEPVYVMSYLENGTIAEVVSYHDYGLRLGGSYTRGYIYSKTLHLKPPILTDNE